MGREDGHGLIGLLAILAAVKPRPWLLALVFGLTPAALIMSVDDVCIQCDEVVNGSR